MDERGSSLKVQLNRVWEHQRKNQLQLFTMTEEHETEAHDILEVLHRFRMGRVAILELLRKMFIHVDILTLESKNLFFFTYVEYLIACIVFKEVVFVLLPICLTHEDIDHAFSSTAEHIRASLVQ